MKTVTQKFIDTQKMPSSAMLRQVWYKRRYWVESSKSYVWESSWTNYVEEKVVGVSDITWQLDIQSLNEFRTSNVTLTLSNLKNQWNGANPYGLFQPDTVSPTYGYEPYWMKFQVRTGLQYSDGTTELVNVFSGLATNYNQDSATGTIQITLTGEEALLIGSNAEAVSTTVTNETATGTVDGSNKVFTTAHNAVGIVSEVSDNGLTKRAGTDYSISQMNDQSNPGKISFIVAPAAGHTVRVTYLYWKTSQKFEDLVTALLNQAGIPGANQFVSPVVFSSSILNSHTWQTQADWNGGALTLIDSASIPNSIEFLYNTPSTINDATTGWTSFAGDGSGSITSDSQGLKILTGTGGILLAQRSQTNVCGDWQTTFQQDTTNAQSITINFMANTWNTDNPYDNVFTNGYRVVYNAVNVNPQISLQYYFAEAGSWADLAYNSSITLNKTLAHTIRIRRNPGGLIRVYLDGALVCQATDTTFTTSTYFGYYVYQSGNVHFNKSTAYLPQSTGVATWISDAVDFGSTPTAWSQFQHAETLSGGAVTYYTRSSADNITYDAWMVVPSNGVVASTLRRFVQTRYDIDITSGDPVVINMNVGAITSSTGITLANFTGMTCYDAITSLAKFANYEFGFDASENFYFRAKNPGRTPVFTMGASDYVVRLSSLFPGYDRVFSKIRTTYAGYLKDISDDGLTKVGPLPRFGYSLQTIDGGNILVSADADVATGMAGSFFNYYRLPRRRVTIQTKIIPQLDISDVVLTSFQDLFPTQWFIGDTSTQLGDLSKSLYGPEEQVLPPLVMKVEGIRLNTNDWKAEFDLEEIL